MNYILPRRIRIDLYVPAEKAISDAIDIVEGMGADELLTDAVELLRKAKNKVSDYVDKHVKKEVNNTNKPLINCEIETNEENTYFKFIKVDEVIRNKDNNYGKNIGTFNGYEIYSYGYPGYYNNKNINIFGVFRGDDNKIVKCNKEVILALEEAGCKVNIID